MKHIYPRGVCVRTYSNLGIRSTNKQQELYKKQPKQKLDFGENRQDRYALKEINEWAQ